MIASAAEFSLYMMKFSAKEEIEQPLKFIERKIGNLLEFNQLALVSNDKKCPFTQMVMLFEQHELLSG